MARQLVKGAMFLRGNVTYRDAESVPVVRRKFRAELACVNLHAALGSLMLQFTGSDRVSWIYARLRPRQRHGVGARNEPYWGQSPSLPIHQSH